MLVLGSGYESKAAVSKDELLFLPDGLTGDQCASLLDLAVAWQMLSRQARLSSGERVWISPDASVAGKALRAVAKGLGAHVLGEAGEPAPERSCDLVYLHGAEARLDDATRLVREGGRVLVAPEVTSARRFSLGVLPDSVSMAKLAPPFAARSTLRSAIEAVANLIASGRLAALPVIRAPLTSLVDGSGLAGDAGDRIHALTLESSTLVDARAAFRLRADATYLITGGTGGFGIPTAQYLVEHGAGNVVLVSRRGLITDLARDAVASMRRAGARVESIQCDVAQRPQVDDLIARLRAEMPPLRGVIHAVVDTGGDKLMQLAEVEAFEVMRKRIAAKVTGGWNLHLATLDEKLDFFLFYSSIASLFPSQGLTTYIAGNHFLDALAMARKNQGLPGLSINFGGVSDVGLLAGELGRGAEGSGFASVPAEEHLRTLPSLLASSLHQVGVARMIWPTYWRMMRHLRRLPCYQSMISANGESDSRQERLRSALLDCPDLEKKHELATSALREVIARVLGRPPEGIAVDFSLARQGLDSLTGSEIQASLAENLGFEIPVVKLLPGPTIRDLACEYVEAIGRERVS